MLNLEEFTNILLSWLTFRVGYTIKYLVNFFWIADWNAYRMG